jgi:hypothetical protein
MDKKELRPIEVTYESGRTATGRFHMWCDQEGTNEKTALVEIKGEMFYFQSHAVRFLDASDPIVPSSRTTERVDVIYG